MINYVVIGVVFSYILFFIGNELFPNKRKYSLKVFLIQFVYIISYILNYYNCGILKVICETLFITIYFKILFKDEILKTTNLAFLIYSIRFSIELCFFILDETVFYYVDFLVFFEKHYVLYCFITATLTYLVVRMLGEKIYQFFSDVKIKSIKFTIYTTIMFILLFCAVIMRNPIFDYDIQAKISIDIILLVSFVFMVRYMIKQQLRIKNFKKKYSEDMEYFKNTEELLEEYRYILHENKNQLLILRGMTNDNKELSNYLDNLINGRKNLKYQWVCDLKNIPIQGLKGLINYKVAQMKEESINVEIYIDDAIGQIKDGTLTDKQKEDLYSIIGIFLDNALEASRISEEKMVSIQCHKDKNTVHVMIANTYTGEIDVEKIKQFGYSSKGKNRGVGLPLVDKIISKSDIYTNEIEFFCNFFVQHLYIQLPKNT